MPRQLLVLPEATAAPFAGAIASAKQSLRLKMFVFTDPGMIAAVVAAKKRGVDVRVMLNPARRNGKDDNAASRKALAAAGVTVRDSNPAFELTHEKSLVVDGAIAYVMSLNWDTENLSQTRDYAIMTTHRKTVGEMIECFDADWKPLTAKLILQGKAPVLPVFFHGQNSRLFQFASQISMTLRLALIFREVHRRIGTRLPISIGEVVPFERIAAMGDKRAVMAFLREAVHELENAQP